MPRSLCVRTTRSQSNKWTLVTAPEVCAPRYFTDLQASLSSRFPLFNKKRGCSRFCNAKLNPPHNNEDSSFSVSRLNRPESKEYTSRGVCTRCEVQEAWWIYPRGRRCPNGVRYWEPPILEKTTSDISSSYYKHMAHDLGSVTVRRWLSSTLWFFMMSLISSVNRLLVKYPRTL